MPILPPELIDAKAGIFRLNLEGKIYTPNSTAIEASLRKIAETGGRHVILECSALEQMDSAALSAIIAGLKRLRIAGGGQLVFCRVNENIRRLLLLTRLDRYTPVVADEAAALALIRADAPPAAAATTTGQAEP